MTNPFDDVGHPQFFGKSMTYDPTIGQEAEKLKNEINKAVRIAFYSYQRKWVTKDTVEMNRNWKRFKLFMNAEMGE